MALTLGKVKQQIVTCTNCDLHASCKSPVPMTAPRLHTQSEHAATILNTRSTTSTVRTAIRRRGDSFIVVGEAPGRIEDYSGKPFVGPAGQLLRSRLENVGLDPDAAYWLNVVCCWPHGTPSPDNVASCRRNLQAQWEAAPPTYVLVCGTTALRALLHTQPKYCRGVGIGLLGKVIFPTYHPAAFAPGRHSVPWSEWDADLYNFSMLVHGEAQPVVTKCIYCARDRAAYAPTCFAHVGKYRLDNQWMVPSQESMNL